MRNGLREKKFVEIKCMIDETGLSQALFASTDLISPMESDSVGALTPSNSHTFRVNGSIKRYGNYPQACGPNLILSNIHAKR
jgi:hypothetical protein